MIRDWFVCVCDPYHSTVEGAEAPEDIQDMRRTLGGEHEDRGQEKNHWAD